MLIERQNIVTHLQQIRTFRETGKPLLYLGETWVDTILTFRKCWQNKEVVGITTNVNVAYRLIVVHPGGSSDFVQGHEQEAIFTGKLNLLTSKDG